jgi:hypothetical protein
MISAICLDNRKLYEIQPIDFEELVAEMLHKQGWEVKLTKKPGMVVMICSLCSKLARLNLK